jgi:YVTN family beta-propeller protein
VHLTARAADVSSLTLEAKIALGNVAGRIDHLAFDPTRTRLYVAELGNDSVGIVDLKAHRLIRTVSGFSEPQGVAYEPTTDTIYVANGGDGSVRLFNGPEFAALGTIALGKDADNVRIDPMAQRVYVGHGNGALAIIDPTTRQRIGDIPLEGHPEGFQLDSESDAVYVNVPEAHHVAVVSRRTGRQIATWPTGNLHANFPMSLDIAKTRVIAVFRNPARLESYEMRSGQSVGGIDVCNDSDDVFIDATRHRVYVICGEGYVDVLDASDKAYTRIGRIATSPGARTGLFVPQLDRLLIAVRASGSEPAQVWLFRPSP